jgi:hypothetical protein
MARSGLGHASRAALAAFALLLGTASASRAEVACGDTIVGDVVLTASLWCDVRFAPALTVAPGAKLDMSGFFISCLVGDKPGVAIAGDGATVRDGAVIGCQTGVLVGGNQGRVENVVVNFAASTMYGIRVAGNQNVVKRSAVAGSAVNAFVVEGNGNRLLRNVGAGGGEATFRVTSGAGNRLSDNLAYFANFNGFLIDQKATGTKLIRNTAAIGEVGFAIYGADGEADENTSAGQNLAGFRVAYTATGNALRQNSSQFSKAGFEVDGNENSLRRNHAYGHGTNGITVAGSQCSLAHNVATGNYWVDLSDLGGCTNDWKEDVFGYRDAPCIE